MNQSTSPVIFGDFSLNYNPKNTHPYFTVRKADGAPVGDLQYSAEIDNVYSTQRYAFVDSVKEVEEITDPEIALEYVRETLNLPDIETYFGSGFDQLSGDDKDYCIMLCFEFALNYVYA